ncbi:MAG: DUF58 domain-containing protein [Candidatus Tectomicrobia bacterium]|nr:DUF58 domain-containing protein [Candidatus Tectomicrobia bacterium]
MEKVLFDSSFLKKLEFLKFVSKRAYRGKIRGEHSTQKRGMSLEFSDYRNYQDGDDYKYVDWNVYSRLDKLFLKIFTAEEDLTIHLLLDTSRSMAFGTPPKIDYARKVAAALGFIGLTALDRLAIASFSSKLGQIFAPRRSRNYLTAMFEFFNRIECDGETDFSKSLADYALSSKRLGKVVVISDFYDEKGLEKGLDALKFRKFDIALVHIVDEEEINPRLSGSVRLVDIETGVMRDLSITRGVLERYYETLEAFFQRLETYCMKSGIEYFRASTIIPFEDLVLRHLRQGSLIK